MVETLSFFLLNTIGGCVLMCLWHLLSGHTLVLLAHYTSHAMAFSVGVLRFVCCGVPLLSGSPLAEVLMPWFVSSRTISKL